MTGGVLPSEVSITEINRAAIPLAFEASDYDPLMRWIGDRRLVLIGEASHGTHDFYRERAAITRRLIEEKGFNAVAIEGDWPDTHRIHRFVRGLGKDATASQALGDFILPYAAVRKAADPDALLLSFLQSTYDAAADLGHWDRTSLEVA